MEKSKITWLFIRQKLIGIAMIALMVLLVWFCSSSNEDCGAAFLVGSLGFVMLFSKKAIIF